MMNRLADQIFGPSNQRNDVSKFKPKLNIYPVKIVK